MVYSRPREASMLRTASVLIAIATIAGCGGGGGGGGSAGGQSVPVDPRTIAVADFNGDGKPDLAIHDLTTTAILLNETPPGAAVPSFAPYVPFSIGVLNVGEAAFGLPGLAAVDLDGDGRPDLVIANIISGSAPD